MDIKYLVMDVDGTLTDGKIYMSKDGEALKCFDIKDGLGIHDILPLLNIIPIIITGRKSRIVENRCSELGISIVFQGVEDKLECLKGIIGENAFQNTIYIGDDLNDLECMNGIHESGGIVACPSDAADEVKAIADYISEKDGGRGAVRDCIEWIKRGLR